jgi:uncharacterized cupredoxin-like copper-binding protein
MRRLGSLLWPLLRAGAGCSRLHGGTGPLVRGGTLKKALQLLFGLALMSTLVIAACEDEGEPLDVGGTPSGGTPAGGTPTGGTPGGGGEATVQVTLSDFAVEADPTSASAGEVRFEIQNEGPSAHNFYVIKTDLPVDGLPTEGGQVNEGEVEVVAETDEFEAGAGEEVEEELDAARYVLICNVPGHYELGMRTEFTVQ